jgi:hypothetical protein
VWQGRGQGVKKRTCEVTLDVGSGAKFLIGGSARCDVQLMQREGLGRFGDLLEVSWFQSPSSRELGLGIRQVSSTSASAAASARPSWESVQHNGEAMRDGAPPSRLSHGDIFMFEG